MIIIGVFCINQFCGLLLCDAPAVVADNEDDDREVISKEEQRKAMDTTFLGKMIECGAGCGVIHYEDGCFGGDCILSYHDFDEKDDYSGEFDYTEEFDYYEL